MTEHDPASSPESFRPAVDNKSLLDRSEDYGDAVVGMLGQLKHRTQRDGREAATRAVWEAYVTGQQEDDPEMAYFCSVMLDGPKLRENSLYLNDMEQREKRGIKRTPDEDETYSRINRLAVESNHQIRNLLYNQRGRFTRNQLINWYGNFTNSNEFARERIAASTAEIATYEAAVKLDDVFSDVRFGSVDDDLKKGDIVGRSEETQQSLAIDVKAGKQLPVGKSRGNSIQLTVGIPIDLVDQYGQVDAEGTETIQRAIMVAYDQARGREHHLRRAQAEGSN